MSEIITEVHTITSVQGWRFNTAAGENVLCLALVSVFNTAYPSLSPVKKIIALDETMMDDLVGLELKPIHTNIAFG